VRALPSTRFIRSAERLIEEGVDDGLPDQADSASYDRSLSRGWGKLGAADGVLDFPMVGALLGSPGHLMTRTERVHAPTAGSRLPVRQSVTP
jgi:hypothetical protein